MTLGAKTGWVGNWSPGIGDPTFAGWLTVVLYAVAAVLCHQAARRCARDGASIHHQRMEVKLWWCMSIVLWFLCVNKQLDLQTALTEYGRRLASHGGWYHKRRIVQTTFIAGLALLGSFSVGLLTGLAWRMSRSVRWAIVGMCTLVVFVLTRASSFHHVDIFLGSSVLGLRWNWALEIGGICVLIAAAAARLAFAKRA